MKDTQLLKYGFVVELDGEAVYDHVVKARLPYADKLFKTLKSDDCPVVAKRCQVASEEGITSPVFCYKGFNGGFDSFQSAYYLSDALTRKRALPVYLAETGEVKNLMPLLNDEERKDALTVVHILRARYITPEIRHPQKAFMQRNIEDETMSSEMIDISDEDILKIFGRLPVQEQLAASSPNNDVSYISDRVAGFAS